MKLTTKQKGYGAILAIGFLALVIDKMYFSPQTASAAPRPAAPVADPISHSETRIDPAPANSEGLISDRLKSLPGVNFNQFRDAFVPSDAWVASQMPALSQQYHGAAARFAAAHKLTAILSSHDGGQVIVDGQVVRVGQKVGELQLIRVSGRSAVFKSGNVEATLTVSAN